MQSFTPEYIELLAEKKLEGVITQKEQKVLEQWLKQEPGEQMIWISEDADLRALRNRLLKRIKEDAGLASGKGKKINLWHRYRWAAAAVILVLILGSLGYYLMRSEVGIPTSRVANIKQETRDVSPGHQGAILTLANGKKMVLDSMGSGSIAKQGNSSLVKVNGQLLYEADKGVSTGKDAERKADRWNTLTTPRGREFQITLADGTKVWLNAASSITYPAGFSGKDRRVTVTGEAYFEVAEDSRHPFIVAAGGAEVKVLGTHFDVMAYTDEDRMKTTLLEGSVRIDKGNRKVTIKPGQQASFSGLSDPIQVEKVDAQQAIAWTEGKLSLDNLDVEAIMRKISRWYNVDIVFEGEAPEGNYWGVINRDVSLQNMLKVLRANGIKASLVGRQVIVSSY